MLGKRTKPIPHPWIDSSRAPMYVCRFPSPTQLSELIGFCAAREKWSETTVGPVAFVVDISQLTTKDASARNREVFAQHLKRFEAFEKLHTCAVGIVAGSVVTRGIVNAVFWLQKPTFEHCVVSTVEEAIVFTQARLEIARHRASKVA